MGAFPQVAACELDRIGVPIAAGGATLAQMNLTVNANAKIFSFVNVGIYNIYVASGRAVDATDYVLLPTGGTSLRVGAQAAAGLRFIADTAETDMNVQQEGDN